MNDPERPRSPDGFDDDAIFADIIAHLNDDETLNDDPAEAGRTTAPEAKDAATDVEPPPEQTGEAADELADKPASLPPGERSRAQWGHSPINPPPGLWTHREPPAEPQTDPQEEPRADSPADPQSVPAPQVWRAHEVEDEDEEHFEPPPTSPLPAGDLGFWAIIAGMAGGPLLLLYLVFFNRNAGSYWILIAIAMSVGGFATLVSRMPGNHEDDDDGARL